MRLKGIFPMNGDEDDDTASTASGSECSVGGYGGFGGFSSSTRVPPDPATQGMYTICGDKQFNGGQPRPSPQALDAVLEITKQVEGFDFVIRNTGNM